MTQREIALRARTAQSVVARIERGQGNPTVETLERLIGAAGFELRVDLVPKQAPDPVVEAYKRDIDRTMLRESLKRSTDERMRGLVAMAKLFAETRRAGAPRGRRK